MSSEGLYFPADKALIAMGNTSRRWQNHFDMNKVFVPEGVKSVASRGPGRGRLRQLSLETVEQGAIAFALIDCGVDVREAYWVGAQFAYYGQQSKPDQIQTRSAFTRAPGKLFAVGDTFLIFANEGAERQQRRLAIVSDADPMFDLNKGESVPGAVIGAVEGRGAAPRIVLNLSKICGQIAASLGLSFTAVFLSEADNG